MESPLTGRSYNAARQSGDSLQRSCRPPCGTIFRPIRGDWFSKYSEHDPPSPKSFAALKSPRIEPILKQTRRRTVPPGGVFWEGRGQRAPRPAPVSSFHVGKRRSIRPNGKAEALGASAGSPPVLSFLASIASKSTDESQTSRSTYLYVLNGFIQFSDPPSNPSPPILGCDRKFRSSQRTVRRRKLASFRMIRDWLRS